MSLLVATDTGSRARRSRRRAVLSKCTVLAVLGLAANTATAQDKAESAAGRRRVVLARVPADHPSTVYAAPGKPLYLWFEAPLGTGAVRAPGVKAYRQPGNPRVLVLVPSRLAAATRSSVPVVVPLGSGSVTLTLAFAPGEPDGWVEVFRPVRDRALAARPAALAREGSASLLRVIAAVASSAPLQLEVSRGGEAAIPDDVPTCRINLVVRTPQAPAGYQVEIRSADRSLCESSGPLSMRADGAR